MNRLYMLFSALLAVPLSAMICDSSFLYFFLIFPFTALLSRKFIYCKRLFLLSIAPSMMLVWAYYSGNIPSSLRSLRWICALSAGTYFASELGTSGISQVFQSMKGFSAAKRFSHLMLLAGSVAEKSKEFWTDNADLPFKQRIFQTTSDAVSKATVTKVEKQSVSLSPILVAVISWLFLLVSISGIADGVIN